MLDAREEGFVADRGHADAPVIRRSQRTLTVEDIAARRAEAKESATLTVGSATVETVPVQSVPPPDSATTLRYARLGFFAALTLVLMLVWLMQRRKESV